MIQKKLLTAAIIGAALLTCSCRSHYMLTGIEHTRILVDNRYDAHPDAAAAAYMAPYKHVVDSTMSPVVGELARHMAAYRPESELSNLLADILVWGGKQYGEKPVFGVYNIGGIRAALARGKVTWGDVLDVAPFENKICFLTMKGKDVTRLFEQIAMRGGEGVSHSVKLVCTADGKLKSARINGEPVDPERAYRIATLDYLAEGNDRLDAFLSKTEVNAPYEELNNVRFIIMDYLKQQMAQGKVVDSQIEGRIIIEE